MLRFVFIFLSFCWVFSGQFAFAQNCQTVPETIEKLRMQTAGTYSIWNTVYGEKDWREGFSALDLSIDGDTVVAAGTRIINASGEKTMIIAEIDKRGRPVWEKQIEIKGLNDVVRLHKLEDHYLVIANKNDEKTKRKAIWLGLIDKEGELKKQNSFQDNKFDLVASDFVMAHDGKSILVSVSKERPAGAKDIFAALYWVSVTTLKPQKHVAYAFGAENRIVALDRLGQSEYIGAGSMRDSSGRLAAWVIKINDAGGFVWQKPFPRGLGSRLSDIINYNDQYFAVTGETMPAVESGRRAGWIMMISAQTGDVAWQRYYRENYNLGGVALSKHDDSQISVIFNGWGSSENEEKDYVRLLTMNARGVLINADSYMNAAGAQAKGLLLGKNKERIIYGDTLIEYKLENEAQDDKTAAYEDVMRSHMGWIVAGSPADMYIDPCVKRIEYLE